MKRRRTPKRGEKIGHVTSPDKRDREIYDFSRKAGFVANNSSPLPVNMYVNPLGHYDHFADRYEVLVVGASRKLVREIRKQVSR